jgi:TetR/AcrR family transcriptional regulator, repressor of fatR-cypB operon
MLAFANIYLMKHSPEQHAYLNPDDAPGKRAILTAALELFASKGIEGTSIRDIGAAAGLTNPALFRHFSGKEALAQYLFDCIYRQFRATLPAVGEEPFSDQLRATLASYLCFFDADLQAALFLQESLRRLWPQMPAALRRQSLIAHLRALLEAGVAQNRVDAQEDRRLLLAAVLGLLGQFARQLFFKEIEGPAISRLDAIHRLVLRTLSAQPSPSRTRRDAAR